MIAQPFFPHYGTNQVLTAGAASAPYSLDKQDKQVRVTNTGANKAYFRTYDSGAGTPAASSADYCVPAGGVATVSKQGHNAIAVISATGTTLEVITGEGF